MEVNKDKVPVRMEMHSIDNVDFIGMYYTPYGTIEIRYEDRTITLPRKHSDCLLMFLANVNKANGNK